MIDGDWLYYLNVDDESCLYRVKTDGSVRERITEVSVLTFYIKDEWIYCTSYNIHHIYKMKKDGSESSLIFEDDTATFVMLHDISDDYIYFINDNSLKKFELNGSNINDIHIDGIWQIEVREDCIYYVTYTDAQGLFSEIYSAKTDGSGIERLTNNNAVAMKVIDDWIYYLSMDISSGSTKLYRVKTDGSSQETFKAEGIFAGFF